MSNSIHRRQFIHKIAIAGAGMAIGTPQIVKAGAENTKPAILGGPKAHAAPFTAWPIFDTTEEKELTKVLKVKTGAG